MLKGFLKEEISSVKLNAREISEKIDFKKMAESLKQIIKQKSPYEADFDSEKLKKVISGEVSHSDFEDATGKIISIWLIETSFKPLQWPIRRKYNGKDYDLGTIFPTEDSLVFSTPNSSNKIEIIKLNNIS